MSDGERTELDRLKEESDERMAVIELLAGYIADGPIQGLPRDHECGCEGEGLDWEGSEWTLCDCVLKKVEPAGHRRPA